MSRLLFAAARGARLEVVGAQVKNWAMRPTGTALFWKDQGYAVRIHPDDAHLQYGPISSALRKFAETGGWPCSEWSYPASLMLKQANQGCSFVPMAQETAINLALFLAEFAADEGL